MIKVKLTKCAFRPRIRLQPDVPPAGGSGAAATANASVGSSMANARLAGGRQWPHRVARAREVDAAKGLTQQHQQQH